MIEVSGKKNCEECCPIGEYTYYYGAVDTIIYCINDARTYMKFFYWVNGNESYGVDSVYSPPLDTITYEIKY